MKVSTSNILMTHPKNAKDQTQYPQIIAAMAISIAATTFMDHPLRPHGHYNSKKSVIWVWLNVLKF